MKPKNERKKTKNMTPIIFFIQKFHIALLALLISVMFWSFHFFFSSSLWFYSIILYTMSDTVNFKISKKTSNETKKEKMSAGKVRILML